MAMSSAFSCSCSRPNQGDRFFWRVQHTVRTSEHGMDGHATLASSVDLRVLLAISDLVSLALRTSISFSSDVRTRKISWLALARVHAET